MLFRSAAVTLQHALVDVPLRAPAIPVLSNVTAQPHTTPDQIRSLLVEQVTASVRWEECVLRLVELGMTEAFEVGPGRVLTGLVKRIAPAITLRALEENPA